MKLTMSRKQVQIDKANLTMIIVMSIASFITIFSLVTTKSLIQQFSYQSKVVDKKEIARSQLEDNLKARDDLVSRYGAFAQNQQNIIGGSAIGTGDRDGDNPQIVLEALPSKYDFPALLSSIEKISRNSGVAVTAIGGTDDEVLQAAKESETKPVQIDMPFQTTTTADAKDTQAFLEQLERSIRPINIASIIVSGTDARLTTTINAKTYYQPEKNLEIRKEVVR